MSSKPMSIWGPPVKPRIPKSFTMTAQELRERGLKGGGFGA